MVRGRRRSRWRLVLYPVTLRLFSLRPARLSYALLFFPLRSDRRPASASRHLSKGNANNLEIPAQAKRPAPLECYPSARRVTSCKRSPRPAVYYFNRPLFNREPSRLHSAIGSSNLIKLIRRRGSGSVEIPQRLYNTPQRRFGVTARTRGTGRWRDAGSRSPGK